MNQSARTDATPWTLTPNAAANFMHVVATGSTGAGTSPDGMTPVVFGPHTQPILGAYHAPLTGSSRRACGVVICPPLGWEGIASQRALRVLARDLALRGFPVLRFDYPGTGDSQGTEFDGERVTRWVESIGLAASELRRLAQATTISLVGVHMGGTLAALAAAGASGISSIALWAPFVSGTAYVRQVRAYRLLNHAERPVAQEGDEEAAGFVLTRETIAALARVTAAAGPFPDCRTALVISRDESSTEEKLIHALQAKDVQVEFARADDYLAMMQEPRKSVVPEATFRKLGDWLSATHTERIDVAPGAPTVAAQLENVGGAVREEPLFLGERNRMFGIATHPPRDQDDRPMLIWLNTASDHRVGPNRSYVTLARALALHGFSSFRFDPTGVGDAELLEGTAPHAYSEQRLEDVREVLDWLVHQKRARRFVLIGLCSAAYVAFHVARGDARVEGVVMINPQTLVWHENDSLDLSVSRSFRSSRDYVRRIFDPRAWRRDANFRGVARIVLQRLKGRVARDLGHLLGRRSADTRELDVQGAFRDLLTRGVDVLMMLGERDAGLDYIEMQLGSRARTLRQFQRFRLEIVKDVDHTFSYRSAKDKLASHILAHLLKRFVPPTR